MGNEVITYDFSEVITQLQTIATNQETQIAFLALLLVGVGFIGGVVFMEILYDRL